MIIKQRKNKRFKNFNDARPRVVFFTHDTFGLGHIRRTLHIMQGVSECLPHSSLLLITGSPVVHTLQALPPNADFVKIPTIDKTGTQGSQPPHLPMTLPEVQLIRERIIQETVFSFHPDLLVVDNFPLGAQRELLPVLHELRRFRIPAILGLRDIVDAPEVICTEWARQGIYEILERYYDKILIYGMKEVLDVAKAYHFSVSLAKKVSYCGYVTEQSPRLRPVKEIKAELGFKGPFVIVTGGGGGDAFPLIETFLSALKFIPKISALVLTGPLMGNNDLTKLKARMNGRANVIFREFVKDLPNYLAASNGVVSMCGYNMAAEILAYRTKAIVVPRTWRYGEHTKGNQAGLEWEQILRARSMAKAGFVDLIEPEALEPKLLARRITHLLKHPEKKRHSAVNMQGVNHTLHHIFTLLKQKKNPYAH